MGALKTFSSAVCDEGYTACGRCAAGYLF